MSGFLYRLGRERWPPVAVSPRGSSRRLGPDAQLVGGWGVRRGVPAPGADSQRAADALAERFPEQTLFTSNVVFHALVDSPMPRRDRIQAAVERLARGAHVISVTDPYDPRGPTISKDDTTAIATVGFDVEQVTPAMYDEAKKPPRLPATPDSKSSTTAAWATRAPRLAAVARWSPSWSPPSSWRWPSVPSWPWVSRSA